MPQTIVVADDTHQSLQALGAALYRKNEVEQRQAGALKVLVETVQTLRDFDHDRAKVQGEYADAVSSAVPLLARDVVSPPQ